MASIKTERCISTGLAWGYHYGFLNIILPKLRENITAWFEANPIEGAKLVQDIIIIFPESCNPKQRLVDYDDKSIEQLKPNVVMKCERAGITRDYSVPMYLVTNPEDPTKKYCVALALNASLQVLYEMSQNASAGLSQEEMQNERMLFTQTLQSILKDSAPAGQAEIVNFNDREDSTQNLATVVAEACRKLTS